MELIVTKNKNKKKNGCVFDHSKVRAKDDYNNQKDPSRESLMQCAVHKKRKRGYSSVTHDEKKIKKKK